MYREKTVAVVIPAYNEERMIRQTLSTLPDYVDKIIVVDDASKDKTSAIVQEIAGKDGRLLLMEHERNQGVGGAIVTGYKKARALRVDVTVVMAGDGQMDPKDLLSFLLSRKIHKEDFIKPTFS